MTLQVRAHFDGHVIVPDEPLLDVPINQPLMVQVSIRSGEAGDATEGMRAFERLLARAVAGAGISSESLRRENMYEGR